MFQVIKREGEVTDFTLTKISDAIIKAFNATDVQYNNDVVDLLALRVTADFQGKVKDDGIHVEDETGLIPCKNSWGHGDKIYIETERPYKLPAKVHVYWQAEIPSFITRDRTGQPLLACYGMEIEKKN